VTLAFPTETAERIEPRVDSLLTVDGEIVYDLPEAPICGGGTRLAPDVTETETKLLARAMTYKLAALGLPIGGAKIGLRAAADERDEVMSRFRVEIADRLGSGRLMTGPDLGTREDDFAGLPVPGGSDGLTATTSNGTPVEERLSGAGVASAIRVALGGDLEGRTVAIEGFGKMGASIARAVTARGARVIAVSTAAGCALAPPGVDLSLPQLLEARESWGDELVDHVGVRLDRAALWLASCDALVPGARPGVLDEHSAQRVNASVVVPVANAPYTATGLRTLVQRGIAAHADFVTSAGGAMAYLSPRVAAAHDVDEAIAVVDKLMASIVEQTLEHEDGPYAGAVARAGRYLRRWLPATQLPDGPPLA